MKGARFKIIGLSGLDDVPQLKINGKKKYCRIMIQRVKEEEIIEAKKTLMDYGKKFVILGNKNAITYKEIFPLIKDNQIWLGVTMQSGGRFIVEDEETTSKAAKCMNGVNTAFICGAHWFTNLDHKKRHEELDLYKHYSPEEFPKYDNYDAIEVSKTCDIPLDYEGVMGVPITFLDKYCPSQFEIVGITENADYLKPLYIEGCEKYDRGYVNGKRMYSRLLIKHV